MKRIISIGLLTALSAISYQLQARNYNIEAIKGNELEIKVGDTLTYTKAATTPYKGKVLGVEANKKYFKESVVKPAKGIAGGTTTTTFTAIKPTKNSTEIEIERYGQEEEQEVNITIKK